MTIEFFISDLLGMLQDDLIKAVCITKLLPQFMSSFFLRITNLMFKTDTALEVLIQYLTQQHICLET